MRILGIDPGSFFMGFALIESQEKKSVSLVKSGVWKPHRSQAFHERLFFLSQKCHGFIEEYQPNVLVLEKSFYGKNVKIAIKMGEIRGVILSLVAFHRLTLQEYSATSIKRAITGYGRATKVEIQKMLQCTLSLTKKFESDDESDAIALAITHHFRKKNQIFSSCIDI